MGGLIVTDNEATSELEPVFTLTEARVIACLMEKELTVPDSYPLTLNSLTLACNQKSNREPLMKLSEGEVGHTTKALEERQLIYVEYGERARRIRHKMCRAFDLDKQQQALLTVMMLRGPQTLNDLKVRTKRMVEFEDNEGILQVLDGLNQGGTPIMKHLPRGAGQREDRYTHLLCGEVKGVPEGHTTPARANISVATPNGLEEIAELKAEIVVLKARLDALEGKS